MFIKIGGFYHKTVFLYTSNNFNKLFLKEVNANMFENFIFPRL